MSKEWYSNREYGERICCPYCGKEYEPLHKEIYIGGKEVDCYKEGEQGEFTCDDCGKKFILSVKLSWEYTTKTIDGEMTWEEEEEKYG